MLFWSLWRLIFSNGKTGTRNDEIGRLTEIGSAMSLFPRSYMVCGLVGRRKQPEQLGAVFHDARAVPEVGGRGDVCFREQLVSPRPLFVIGVRC